MRALDENRYGVDFRDLVEPALARPQNAAIYANADIIGQAATLLFGLIKNHPWLGGNKRTATTSRIKRLQKKLDNSRTNGISFSRRIGQMES